MANSAQKLDWIDKELAELHDAGLARHVRSRSDRDCIQLSSNDYLSLSRHPRVTAAAASAIDSYGSTARASRIVSGTTEVHLALESQLAEFLHAERVLVFGTGYQANVGLLSALAGRDDTICIDRLAHASLVDGAVLSRAKISRFRHNDVSHLRSLLEQRGERGRVFVVTESVFSMDGDIAPIPELLSLCEEFGAIPIIDEAHALGVFGPNGSGCVAESKATYDALIRTGTLSKSFASFGGFVAAPAVVCDYLVSRARSFIYSTGLPPASAGAALAALELMRENPEWGRELRAKAREFATSIGESGAITGSQIVPYIVPGNEQALSCAEFLRQRGVEAVAIRSPTVPAGSERIRFSLAREHTSDDMKRVADLLREWEASHR